MPDESYSQPELIRWLKRLEADNKDSFQKLSDKIDRLAFVDKTLYERDRLQLDSRITALETEKKQDKQWNKNLLWQSILVPLIVGVLVAVMVAVILA